MKKIGALILLLTVCLSLAASALAETGPVGRSDSLAAYVDGDGHLFLPGRTEAVNTNQADGIVAINAYRVLYYSPDEFLGTRDLYMIDLGSLKESLVASGVHAACLSGEDTAWYVTQADRTKLMRVDLNSLSAQNVYTAAESIDRLYLSVEGLLIGLVDDAGVVLYTADTDSFEIYSGEMPESGLAVGDNEVYLTDGGELYLKSGFNYGSTLIDTNVTAYTRLRGAVYYLTRSGSALRLKTYDPSTRKSKVVLTPGVKMANQLTATDNALFMLTADDSVCRVDVKNGKLAIYRRYADLSSYKLPAGYNVDGLRIEGMSGQLNVYAELSDANAKPEFSFIEFESDTDAAEPNLKLIDVNVLEKEEPAWSLLKPAAQYEPLSRGCRGEAVSAIQKPLKELGYYDYYVDGIYGPRTQAAVRLLQFDLDRPITGVADAELQRIILSGKLHTYDPYLQLARGNRGLRVQLMQERLRELGYLADAADGIFGPRTLKAVKRFQQDNGLEESDAATRETLRLLFSDKARVCRGYIDLYPGDTGWRVRELNRRLVELYFLEESPGSRYTSETASAVRMFQRTAGLEDTGDATQRVLRLMFSDDAPEAPGYITLRRGDENDRVTRLQRRLKELNYYHGKCDGYYGKYTKEAVALFQKKVGLKATGVATVRTQQLLFASDAPEYVKPTKLGEPDIWPVDYEYEENGIYFVSEDNTTRGFVLFNWDVEGDVESYNVEIRDDVGNEYLDRDTTLTSTGVSIDRLDFDTVYTLRVTAYPEDGNDRHITRGEISFARADEHDDPDIEDVGIPEITVETVAREESGICYLESGTVTFSWYAEGSVDSYYIEIRDEEDDVVLANTTTDEQLSISSASLNGGEIYTLFVYAIPENGTIREARDNFLRFAMPEVELPTADIVPETLPEPTLDDVYDDLPEEEWEEEFDGDLEEVEVIEEDIPSEPDPDPAGDTPLEPEAPEADEPVAPEAGDNTDADAQQPEDVYPEPGEDTTAPEEDITEPGESYDEPEQLDGYDGPEPEDSARTDSDAGVTPPTLGFAEQAAFEDGVTYVSGDVLTMSWYSEGDLEGYYVELFNGYGDRLYSDVVSQEALSTYTANLDPADVYTLTVTAIPAGRSVEEGPSSSARFALYVAADEAADSAPEAEYPDEDDYDVPGQEETAPEDNWQMPEEEDVTEPEEDYTVPEEDTTVPEEDYTEPGEQYAEPEEDYTVPEEDYTVPEEDYAVPEEDYTVPEEDYTVPEEDYAVPEEDYTVPEEDYTVPEEDYTEPGEQYAEPEEWYTEPEEWDTEPEEDTTEPEDDYIESEEDDFEPEEDDYASGISSDEIASIQKQLVKLGWLSDGSYSTGVLDDATVYAVSCFQDYCNSEYGLGLPSIYNDESTVDEETMSQILYGDYSNPDA